MIKYNWYDKELNIDSPNYNILQDYGSGLIGFNELSGAGYTLRLDDKFLLKNHGNYTALLRRKLALKQPCLFISHRQSDKQEALRVAYIATALGYDIFLDILDPYLQQASNPYLIANRIELALLNSTHVIAMITPNTRGSMWVPYEYGRVKDHKPISSSAGCWIHPQVQQIAEYLHLGEVNHTENEIEQWLQDELAQYSGVTSQTWAPNKVPAPLP